MTDAEKLAKIREWMGSPMTEEFLNDHTAPYYLGYRCGHDLAKYEVGNILNAQPDPHPLGSVRFDEATEEQFKEFWKAAGFESAQHWAQKFLAGDERTLAVFKSGRISLCDECSGAEFDLSFEATFQEALDALNELAETKIMGGWA